MPVMGPWMARLRTYVQGSDPDAIGLMIERWSTAGTTFTATHELLSQSGKAAEDGFSSASRSGVAARRSMETSGTKAAEKSQVIRDAVDALSVVQSRMIKAQYDHARLESTLPGTLGSPPSSADFPTKGTGTDSAKAVENQKALTSAKSAYAAKESAIAEAERVAAQHVQDIDTSVDDAEPKVRALYDDGSTSDPVPPGSSSSPGSYSDAAAARSRMASYNSGTMYPGGWGQDLKAEERANIAAYEAENRPEWNGNEWINADGSPAPATSYAMVETADGLAPLSGGTGGMSALAVGGGGALLGAGVAKAIASRFGGGAARAGTAGAASKLAAARSASARSAAAKAGGAASSRAGTAGAGSRAAGAGARGAAGAGSRGAGAGARGAAGAGGRGAKGGPAGAGSRAGRAGASGAGGRGGRKKDDQQNSQDQDWQADYTDDWTDPNYKASPTVIGDEWKRRQPQQDDE